MNSYSQCGEDMIAWHFLGRDRHHGVYVDVGANDPHLYSNTYSFYEHGWSGTCLEPLPEKAALLKTARPRDRVANVAVGPAGTGTLSIYGADGLSSLVLHDAYQQHAGLRRVGAIQVLVRPLAEFMQPNVDLLSVDVEGYEMQVLASNDWEQFRPKIVIVETKVFWSNERFEPAVTNFMTRHGYVVLADTFINTIYCLPEIRR